MCSPGLAATWSQYAWKPARMVSRRVARGRMASRATVMPCSVIAAMTDSSRACLDSKQ